MFVVILAETKAISTTATTTKTTASSTPIEIIVDGYANYSRNISCDYSPDIKWASLAKALDFCNKYNCKGVHDKNCDGKSTYTCGKINRITFSDSNGCTYTKIGKEKTIRWDVSFVISY